jgi:hypothetical protein
MCNFEIEQQFEYLKILIQELEKKYIELDRANRLIYESNKIIFLIQNCILSAINNNFFLNNGLKNLINFIYLLTRSSDAIKINFCLNSQFYDTLDLCINTIIKYSKNNFDFNELINIIIEIDLKTNEFDVYNILTRINIPQKIIPNLYVYYLKNYKNLKKSHYCDSNNVLQCKYFCKILIIAIKNKSVDEVVPILNDRSFRSYLEFARVYYLINNYEKYMLYKHKACQSLKKYKYKDIVKFFHYHNKDYIFSFEFNNLSNYKIDLHKMHTLILESSKRYDSKKRYIEKCITYITLFPLDKNIREILYKNNIKDKIINKHIQKSLFSLREVFYYFVKNNYMDDAEKFFIKNKKLFLNIIKVEVFLLINCHMRYIDHIEVNYEKFFYALFKFCYFIVLHNKKHLDNELNNIILHMFQIYNEKSPHHEKQYFHKNHMRIISIFKSIVKQRGFDKSSLFLNTFQKDPL